MIVAGIAVVEVDHRVGVGGEPLLPGCGVLRELVELHDGRHQPGAVLDHRVDEVLGETGAVLDAVDARLDQPGQHAVAEAVRRHLGALGVRGGDGVGEGLRGERRGEVALVARDPVADQLDPAVAVAGLLGGVRRQVGRLHLVGVAADVALRRGDVPAAADQPGQVVAVVDPARVGGRTGVADEERPAVAVGDRLLLGGRVVGGTEVVEPEVAVRVDQAGDDPALGDGVGARLRLVGDAAVDDVEVARLAVGQDRSTEALR